jgi:hypothetical protein
MTGRIDPSSSSYCAHQTFQSLRQLRESTSPDGAIEGLVQSRGARRPPSVRLLGTVRARLMLAPNPSSCVSSSPSGGCVAARWMCYCSAEGEGLHTTGTLKVPCRTGSSRSTARLNSPSNRAPKSFSTSSRSIFNWSSRKAPHDHWAPVAS